MLVGGAADTVGMEEGAAGKGWGEGKYLLGLAGRDRQTWGSHRLVGGRAHQPGHGALAHIGLAALPQEGGGVGRQVWVGRTFPPLRQVQR